MNRETAAVLSSHSPLNPIAMTSFGDSVYSLLGSYIDGSRQLNNSLFPTVSNYEDDRIVILIVAGSLAVLTVLLYLVNLIPTSFKHLDYYSGTYQDATLSAKTHSFQPMRLQSRFGGTRE